MSGDTQLPAEKLLQGYFANEIRLLNTCLPLQRKSLADLLTEAVPHVACSDGTRHVFKKKELRWLAETLDQAEYKDINLPVLLEIMPDSDEVRIMGQTSLLVKLISKILGIAPLCRAGNVIVHKSQLGEIRKVLRTTTQYLFSMSSTD